MLCNLKTKNCAFAITTQQSLCWVRVLLNAKLSQVPLNLNHLLLGPHSCIVSLSYLVFTYLLYLLNSPLLLAHFLTPHWKKKSFSFFFFSRLWSLANGDVLADHVTPVLPLVFVVAEGFFSSPAFAIFCWPAERKGRGVYTHFLAPGSILVR